MFAFLPFISLIFLFLIFHQKNTCWRNSALSAAIVWGLFLTAITEILSLGRLLTYNWLIFIWSFIDVVLIYIFFRFIKKNKSVKEKAPLRLSSFSILLLCGVAFIVLMVGLIALTAAPNNWDSMSYRMARVVHWIQNRSVAYYPTNYLPQLYQKPWAEFVILHLQILSRGDRFANIVQWFSMLGSILGVSLIAKQIGADLRGQIFSAVVCATIPMGILQGSSTQNDYVVSFWLVCFVYYILLSVQPRKSSDVKSIKIGASLGLAFLTKATAYIYAIPFFVWFLCSGIKRLKWKFWKPLIIISLLVFTINIPHEIRNIDLFGVPIASGEEKYTNEAFNFSILLSNIIRNISLHIGTPIQPFNNSVEKVINLIHTFLGVGIVDPRSTQFPGMGFGLPGLVFHEDGAANTLHLLLTLVAITVFLKRKDLKKEKKLAFYFICVTATFLLFSFILKWQPFHSRLHLPLFVLFSVFIGILLSKISNHKIANYVALVLIFSSLLLVFFNTSRPLVAQLNRKILTPSSYQNIFNTSRIDQYFNNRTELRKPYKEAISFLKSQECSKVGLSIPADEWEYPFWIMMQNNNKKYQFEQIDVKNISANKYQEYPHNQFIPCAIFYVKSRYQVEPIPKEIINSNGIYVQKFLIEPVSVFMKK